MILTITANPSVDISYELNEFLIDDVNRTSKVIKEAGGKGIHVSYVLKQLGEDVVNSGFVGGKLGDFIVDSLDKKEIKSEFVRIKEDTRNCIAILHDGNQTEILESGPSINKDDENKFLSYLEENIDKYSIVNISGSLPKGLDSSFYEQIIKIAKNNNKFISVDTSGKVLEDVVKLEVKPNLIKPNETEIKAIIKKDLKDDKELAHLLKTEPLKDIEYIIVSQGKDGAVVKIKDKLYKATVPSIKPVNPVGSGDSTIAGALSAISNNESDEIFIKKSMVCGVLNAMDKEIAHLDMNLFDDYMERIKLEEIG